VQSNAGQPLLLFHNITENPSNCIELKLIGVKSNRDAIGARIRVQTRNLTQIREIDGGNGYAAQSTRRAHFGLGKPSKLTGSKIKWPSEKTEVVTVPINQISYIKEGQGVVSR